MGALRRIYEAWIVCLAVGVVIVILAPVFMDTFMDPERAIAIAFCLSMTLVEYRHNHGKSQRTTIAFAVACCFYVAFGHVTGLVFGCLVGVVAMILWEIVSRHSDKTRGGEG